MTQNERENLRKRQVEEIKIAKEKKVHIRHPKYRLLSIFEEIVTKYKNNEFTNAEASKILNISRGTFLKYSKEYKKIEYT